MSNKSLLKFGIAFGLLAVVLIFLGVNYVPRIYASSSAVVVAGKQTRIDYIDERYPRAIAMPLSYAGSDWIERHPVQPTQPVNYAGPDWIGRQPVQPTQPLNYAGSDWIERHPAQPVNNAVSDWIEPYPPQPSQ